MIGKKGKTDLLPIIAILLIAAIAFGFIDINQFIPKSVVTVEKEVPTEACLGLSSPPDLLVNAYDIENKGTAVTEATNLYRKIGTTTWNTFTQGTEITDLEAGETYEFVMGISTTDFTDNAFGPYFTMTIPCREDTTIDKGVYNDEIETSLTATFLNNNHDASAQTFSAGDTYTVYLKWKAGQDEVYGNPFIKDSPLSDVGKHRKQFPNLLVLKLNTTEWDEPDKVWIYSHPAQPEYVGMELRRIGCPAGVSSATGFTLYCYEAPVIFDRETEIAVDLNADDSNAPANDGTAYLYSSNFYVNSDTGALEWGNFNEDDVAVGADAPDSLTLDFT